MNFSHQTIGTMIQFLKYFSNETKGDFLYKHTGYTDLTGFSEIIRDASPEEHKEMLAELLIDNQLLYDEARVKWVFKDSVENLKRWALLDGWIVDNGKLLRLTHEAEDAVEIRDKLLQDLESSGLDGDNSIRRCVENSAKHFADEPPDFNASINDVRITLETVARRAANALAKTSNNTYEKDSWGSALLFLRKEAVIEEKEENVLAAVYTFVSDGSHVPQGVSQEEWARLARVFGLSSAYFLLQKYLSTDIIN